MARLPPATRESVPKGHQEAFDKLVKSMGEVPVYGPSSVLMHVPKARLLQDGLNNYLRTESCLPKKTLELAMLVMAREMDCQYIWHAHAASARKEGVRDSVVDSLRDRKELPALLPDEAAVVCYAREFFKRHYVGSGTFQLAMEQFGRQGVVELGLLLGMYCTLALLINSFDTDMPSDRTEPLLPL